MRRLATGGMAELFLARATAIHGFEKLVVLKRILPQHAQSEDFIRMFLAEARLAATLHHPNIVQVYDIGEEAETYFFTMEYVQGQDLRKLVRAARKAERSIPLEHILHIVMGIAAGLNHAHEKIGLDGKPLGIVHRDVSPSNVLVTYDGGVKIVDFGIAKAATAQTSTLAGTLKGKIPYMSPEQCRGEMVDRRSDIFSIGTLLWEMTTGSRLFSGDNEFAILNKVAKGEVPSPTSLRPDYPPELEAIVMRALQADRDQRYGSALDLQIDLEDFAREARLPVSSARMAKFMRQLFSEEIRQTTLQLQADRMDEAPTMPRPALATETLAGAGQPTSSSAERTGTSTESSVDLTPSEVRSGQALATPGPSDISYATGLATDLEVEGKRSGGALVALAVLTGILFVLGISTLVYFVMRSSGDEAEDDKQEPPAPAVIVEEAAPPEPPRHSREPPKIQPRPQPALSSPSKKTGEKPAGDDPDAEEPEAEAEPAVEAEPESTDAEQPTLADEPSTPPKDDKTGSTSKKGGGKRPSGRKKGGKGSSGSKPWNPDSPFPT